MAHLCLESFYLFQYPMALLKKELRSHSLLREHHFSISGTLIALRNKQQYLYYAIGLNFNAVQGDFLVVLFADMSQLANE